MSPPSIAATRKGVPASANRRATLSEFTRRRRTGVPGATLRVSAVSQGDARERVREHGEVGSVPGGFPGQHDERAVEPPLDWSAERWCEWYQ